MFCLKAFVVLQSCLSYAAFAASVNSCPGYTASKVAHTSSGLTATLKLAGKACNAYGTDLKELRLKVEYETGQSYNAPSHNLSHRISQILDFMSRSTIRRCKFTKSLSLSCRDQHPKGRMVNPQRSSSRGLRIHSLSPSLGVQKPFSTHLDRNSSLNRNTCD